MFGAKRGKFADLSQMLQLFQLLKVTNVSAIDRAED